MKTNLVLFALVALLLVSLGCSQGGVEQVDITPRHPSATRTFQASGELQGTSVIQPSSTSAVLKDHALGGNSARTVSQSTSFRMTSGIGVQ